MRAKRTASEINLGQVMRHLEDNRHLVECFGPDGACIITPTCAARKMFREAQEAFFAVFDGYALSDMPARRVDLLKVLPLGAA